LFSLPVIKAGALVAVFYSMNPRVELDPDDPVRCLQDVVFPASAFAVSEPTG
jgi:hypothetical protein